MAYDDLELRSTSPSFDVDAMWGVECSGYHFQFRPEPDVIGEIVCIQDRIASELDHLRRVPPEALHMTVLTLLPATSDKAAVEGAWARFGARCIAAGSRLSGSSGPLPVEWTSVRAFDKAIVLAGKESERLKKFRADVADVVAEPGLRPQAPRIAHVSLFRYAEIDPRLQGFTMHCGTVAAELREIRLVREDKYPSLELEVLRRWPLGHV